MIFCWFAPVKNSEVKGWGYGCTDEKTYFSKLSHSDLLQL